MKSSFFYGDRCAKAAAKIKTAINAGTVGVLGWGQIQIAKSNNIVVDNACSGKAWMLDLCEAMKRFDEVKSYWQSKRDIWI